MAIIRDIARLIASKHQLKQTEADHFVQSMIEVIKTGLANDRQVKIKGFGTFKLQAVKERSSVNISTGERVIISGHDKITFTPDNVMRDIINKPFAHFETVIVEEGSPLLDESIEIDDERDDNENNDIIIESAVSSDNSGDIHQPKAKEAVIAVEKGAIVENDAVICEAKAGIVESEAGIVESEAGIVESEPDIADAKDDLAEKNIEDETETQTDDVIENDEAVLESNNDVREEPIEELPKESTPEQVANEAVVESEPEEIATEKPKVLAEDTSNREDTSVEEEAPDYESEEEEQIEDDMNACPGQYNRCRNIFIYYGILINVIVAIIAFVCGYMYSEYNNSCSIVPQTEVIKQEKVATKAKNNDLIEEKAVVKNDTVAKKDVKKDTEATKPQTAEKEKKAEEAPAKAKVTEPKKDEIKPLNFDSDPRVRTGAYYIIGTELEVTVKEGQTLKSISKSYLGADMECYVEAYNNKKEVKAGDKVRIPKLILKKRLKK